MSSGVKYFLELLGFAIVVIVLYNLARKYVLSKIKVNKWVVLSIAVLVFLSPILLSGVIPNTGIWTFVPSGIFVILLLWFMDLSGWGAAKYRKNLEKKNDVVIKPKAKPNRVKNNK